MERRDIALRNASWTQTLAKLCVKIGITPNQLSIASIFFASLAGISYILVYFYQEKSISLYSLAIIFIIIKLLCNLFDGMLAIEHNQHSPTGMLYNDVPDRISDVLIFVGAGFSIQGFYYAEHLGWLAAVLAILTAYIRFLGASLGAKAYFSGPMGKEHRSFVIIFGTLLQIGALFLSSNIPFVYIALAVIILGSAITCIRRLINISNEIWEKSK